MKAPGATAVEAVLAPVQVRFADLSALVRPRVALMVLVTVLLGGLLAGDSLLPSTELWHVVLATGIVAAGASILNQWLERATDGLMPRTADRPLATGRIRAAEGLLVGTVVSAIGLAYMLAAASSPLPAAVTAFTLLSYVLVYTPLKRITTLNTLVGAVPGALPPVIGWTAVRGELDVGALALFLIVFVWQVPHFLAIAWMYRDQYAAAGLQMLTVNDRHGERTARQMLLYGLALVPVSLTPVQIGMAGPSYAVGAGLLAASFLWPIARFQRQRSVAMARRVLKASLIYLPGVLALLLISKYWV
jgi:protoheme IX farnesyltransferase